MNPTKQFLAEVGGLHAQVTVSMKECSNASASVSGDQDEAVVSVVSYNPSVGAAAIFCSYPSKMNGQSRDEPKIIDTIGLVEEKKAKWSIRTLRNQGFMPCLYSKDVFLESWMQQLSCPILRKKQSEQDDPLKTAYCILAYCILADILLPIAYMLLQALVNCRVALLWGEQAKLSTSFAFVLLFICCAGIFISWSGRVSTTRYVYSCDMQVLHVHMDTVVGSSRGHNLE